MIYLQLIIGFLKVGLFSFGGAYGAIPLIRDIVISYQWLDEGTLTSMIAVSESTPGPIMINLATYIGSRLAGLQGAIIATTCVVLPSFIVIILICIYMNKIMKNKYFNKVIQGLKPCIIGIIIATGLCMCIKQSLIPSIYIKNIILLVILLTIKYFVKNKLTAIHLILISACLGILIYA